MNSNRKEEHEHLDDFQFDDDREMSQNKTVKMPNSASTFNETIPLSKKSDKENVKECVISLRRSSSSSSSSSSTRSNKDTLRRRMYSGSGCAADDSSTLIFPEIMIDRPNSVDSVHEALTVDSRLKKSLGSDAAFLFPFHSNSKEQLQAVDPSVLSVRSESLKTDAAAASGIDLCDKKETNPPSNMSSEVEDDEDDYMDHDIIDSTPRAYHSSVPNFLYFNPKLNNLDSKNSVKKEMSDPFLSTAPRPSRAYMKYCASKRISFYSEDTDLIQSENDLLFLAESTIVNTMRKSVFWIDICDPSDAELKTMAKVFNLHPLSVEDIQVSDTREKCEVFQKYMFICVQTCDEDYSYEALHDPLSLYICLFDEYIITFHKSPLNHIKNVLRRMDQLKSYLKVTADWVMYALLDDVVDSFIPSIRNTELEVDSIDDLVLILSEAEQQDMLRRIGSARKRTIYLLRLLKPKATDVLKTLIKRVPQRLNPHTRLYLRDIMDHAIEMVANLDHFNETLNRSHSNYLAQISIELTQASNRMNVLMKKFTAVASILLPLSLVAGMMGMNVPVPGQEGTGISDYGAFFLITAVLCVIAGILLWIGKKSNWF